MTYFYLTLALAILILTILFVLILLFDFINYLRGYAPSLSTNKNAIKSILEIYDFEPGQKIAELGVGYGNILRELKKLPVEVTGFEINPILVIFLKLRFFLNKSIEIKHKNFLNEDLSKYDVVIIYGIPNVMATLEQELKNKGVQNLVIISNKFAFKNIRHEKNLHNIYVYKI